MLHAVRDDDADEVIGVCDCDMMFVTKNQIVENGLIILDVIIMDVNHI